MPVCAQCGTDNPEIAKFCLACGSPLAVAPPPQEFRKIVTIVFSDLKGSTAMGEKLDSESLREVMTRYFDAMSAELVRHGGVVEKRASRSPSPPIGSSKCAKTPSVHASSTRRSSGELTSSTVCRSLWPTWSHHAGRPRRTAI
jgi:zinc-ribbon domain